MKSEGVRHLLVAAPGGRLAGAIAMDDRLDALAGAIAGIVRAIRSGFTLRIQPVDATILNPRHD